MPSIKVLILFLLWCGLVSCQRTGYEIFRQMNYQECLKQSPHPADDCQFAPDFDQYQQLRKDRYPE